MYVYICILCHVDSLQCETSTNKHTHVQTNTHTHTRTNKHTNTHTHTSSPLSGCLLLKVMI